MMTGSRCRTFATTAWRAGLIQILFAVAIFYPLNSHAEHFAFPGEYVVGFRPSTASTSGLQTSASRRVKLPRNKKVAQAVNNNAFLVVPSNQITFSSVALPVNEQDTFCKDLLTSGAADSCSPNYEMKIAGVTTNDPSFDQLWGMSADRGIDAPRAWELSTGSNDVVVGVVDTGIDYNHPDLQDNMWRNASEVAGNGIDDDNNGVIDDIYGFNAIDGSGNPLDNNLHGTHCAGTIGGVGNNRIGVVGVNQRVKLMALKFLDNNGSGSLANAIKAIDYAVAAKRKHGITRMVLSNSWGGGGFSQPLKDAIERARAEGIAFIAAAGNESNDNDANPSYPATYDVSNVVSVAAVDKDGNLASFSNYGASSVDIAAPGVGIYSTSPNNGYATLSGTSMATPHVSGAVALLWAHDSSLSLDAVIERIYLSGKTLAGLLDSGSGVSLVRTQRMLNVGRMLYNETAPLPSAGEQPAACGYDFSASNLLISGQVDTSADNEALVNQADEGSFVAVPLKFDFPFFRSSTRVIYLSPNGLVYTKAPTALDYQVSGAAPGNSIAALHTDLTPTKAYHGIKISSKEDRITIAWVDEQYGSQGQGDILARLTLYSNGGIENSVAFGSAGELVNLRRSILGDPYAAAPTPAKALIGITGGSSSFSSTVDLAAVQKSVDPSGTSPLILGVRMASNCEASTPAPSNPVVQSISLKQAIKPRSTASTNGNLKATLSGTGSGTVTVAVAVNRWQCSEAATVTLSNGSASFSAKTPPYASQVTLGVSSVSKTLRLKNARASRKTSPAQLKKMCTKIIGSIR